MAGCSGDSWDSLASVVEFGIYYGIWRHVFLNVFLDCMFLTRMFMVIVFGACHVLKKPRQRHH